MYSFIELKQTLNKKNVKQLETVSIVNTVERNYTFFITLCGYHVIFLLDEQEK